MLLRNRIFIRAFAIFFILEILTNAVWPSISYALTAGPTAPEATSFEPVDTTDMVNPLTGDLTYNIPLIEVPGPGGGYPLSLAYHAGIMTNEEASWVGLGWNLNPGAINRNVSGYPDDYLNAAGTDRTFWEGGTSQSLTVGINVGYTGAAGVGVGLVFADDTYRGFGVGGYAELQIGRDLGSFARASITHRQGVSPYGDTYSSTGGSVGIGVGSKKASGSLAASFRVDQNGGMSGNIGVEGGVGKSTIGASISSASGISVSGGYGKVSSQTGGINNSKAGNISTKGFDQSIDIPTPWGFSVRLGASYQRYWIDESETAFLNGALNFPAPLSLAGVRAYDVYDLVDPVSSAGVELDWGLGGSGEYTIPTEGQFRPPDEYAAGVYLDYDNYLVLGQGISGSMRPYHYQARLIRQSKISDGNLIMGSYLLNGTNPKPHFRFVGDFSNRYLHDQSYDLFKFNNGSTSSTNFSSVSFSFDSNRVTGENGDDGYNWATNVLPGSKNVEWFSNAQIKDKNQVDVYGDPILPGLDAAISKGFIDCKANGFVRDNNASIGGFKVTNSSGVTYHYALPVYAYDEWSYSGRQDHKNRHYYNSFKKPEKYATSWLLTAVTGPDYVDRNKNGFADNDDWGYWVAFDYGKWSGSYSWRNPATDFVKDLDQNFNNFSKGKKEVYYLDLIRTKTHSAVFVKELRLDGKGVVHELDGVIKSNSSKRITDIDNGGFNEKVKGNYTEYPVSTLKLKSIYLLKNSDLIQDEVSFNWAKLANVYFHHVAGTSGHNGKFTHGQNVIDVHDVNTPSVMSLLQEKALRRIDLNTDYSLSSFTENSFLSQLDVHNTSQLASSSKNGKLTLNSIKYYGKNGVSTLPDTRFYYDDKFDFYGQYSIDIPNESILIYASNPGGAYTFERGEIVKFTKSSKEYFGYIEDVTSNIRLKIIHGDISLLGSGGSGTMFTKTKNPPYHKDRFDMWSMYKCDFNNTGLENIDRMTTITSSKSTDVWSLRQISTSLGAKVKIEYEADTYQNSIKKLANVPIKMIDNTGKITLYEKVSDYGLKVGDAISGHFVSRYKYGVYGKSFKCDGSNFSEVYKWDSGSISGSRILSIDGNSLTVNSAMIGALDEATMGCPNLNPNYTLNDCGIPYGLPGRTKLLSNIEFIGGELFLDYKPFAPYGGDLRVKELTIENGSHERTTEYDYTNGITTYEPLGFAVPFNRLKVNINNCLKDLEQEAIDGFRSASMNTVYGNFMNLINNSRELPGPGVKYEKVRVTERIKNNNTVISFPGSVEYQFEVFWPESDNAPLRNAFLTPISTNALDPWGPNRGGNVNGTLNGRNVTSYSINLRTTIKDYSAMMGTLKRVTYFDERGDKINETINDYLHDNFSSDSEYQDRLESLGHQGLINETFADARLIKSRSTNEYGLVGITSQRVQYPSIQIGQTTINYKTGIKEVSKNLKYDFYSGQATKVLSSDGFGNSYVTESLPAYRIYPLMGLTANGGYNMLTQEARNSTYKVANNDFSSIVGLKATAVQTWSGEIPMLGYDGAGEKCNLTRIYRVYSNGKYLAESSRVSNFLRAGERIKFNLSDQTYYAMVLSSFYNETARVYEYELQFIVKPQEISTEHNNIVVDRVINVLRKHASFTYIGQEEMEARTDGLYSVQDDQLPIFTNWNWTKGDDVPAAWLKTSEITLTDKYSHALEAQDMSDIYAATKMSADQARVLATASNSQYNEFAYSGAEETPLLDQFGNHSFGGQVFIEGFTTDRFVATPHTGKYSLKASSSTGKGFIYSMVPVEDKIYRISFWSKSSNAQIKYKLDNGSELIPVLKVRQAGDWYLVEGNIYIDGTYNNLLIWCSGTPSTTLFDDFRVHPVDASMTSYVYNQWDELSHILDNNNLYTEYLYDSMGRLKETKRETFFKAESDANGHNYGAAGIVTTGSIFYNYGTSNPYKTIISTSKSGPSGSLVPAPGDIEVLQGGQLTVEVKETCTNYNRLQSITIDGLLINSSQPSRTLPDGTQVTLSGKVVTFKNIQSQHTLHATFMTSPSGWARCYSSYVNGVLCYDGSIEYGSYGSCGEEIIAGRASNAASLPSGYQQYAPLTPCCDNTGGPIQIQNQNPFVPQAIPPSSCPCEAN